MYPKPRPVNAEMPLEEQVNHPSCFSKDRAGKKYRMGDCGVFKKNNKRYLLLIFIPHNQSHFDKLVTIIGNSGISSTGGFHLKVKLVTMRKQLVRLLVLSGKD